MRLTESVQLKDVLISSGPSTELGSEASLYGWLIGSWKMKAIDYEIDGSRYEAEGEWHFSWALEGRAIQDVFIVPSRELRPQYSRKERNRYGTTIRMYDPMVEGWRITWINPVQNVECHLIGRKIGSEIVQEGLHQDGKTLMRWCFKDITANSFRWTGEESKDNGKSWRLSAEFFGAR